MARRSAGLLGRILAIVLLAVAFEFAASTFLYERAETVRMNEEEAHRVAEHLAIAYQFLSALPPQDRRPMARQLSSAGLTIKWLPGKHVQPTIAPALEGMRAQIVRWEPRLGAANLRLYLYSPGRHGVVKGTLSLPDDTTLAFVTPALPKSLSFTLNRVLLAFIPAIALVVIAGLLIRRTLKPLNHLAQAAERIGEGKTTILPPSGPGELRRVIRAFNAMQDRIHHLIADRTQALAAVGHDLRTPIARLQLRTEQVDDPQLREAMQNDVGEMEHMLDSLLSYLRGEGDTERRARSDLAVLLRTIIDDAQDQGARASYMGPDHAELCFRPIAVKRALTNLVENALKYGGSVRASLAITERRAIIRVEDDGPGIEEERLHEAVEPFVRLDTARSRDTNGLGLGLAIVKRAIEGEGGMLSLSNMPAGGLRAEISLPA